MNSRSLLHRKRVWLPVVSLLLLIGAGGLALHRSDTSRVIVYNQTGSPIVLLRITACSQSTVFRDVGDEDSFRWKLRPGGTPGEIELETATEPVWQWRGAYIRPRGGYRVTLRLWPDGVVEAHTQISFWQRLLRGAPPIND